MSAFVFVTENQEKLAIMTELMAVAGVDYEYQKIETPEIQADHVQEVAEFSAKYAAKKLNKPCVVTDAGCEILALNGFPGPFIKYINKQLSADKILKMMEDETDRRVVFKETLSYAEPNGFVKSFTVEHWGNIQFRAEGDAQLLGKSAPMNEITLFEGCDKVMAAYSYEDMLAYFGARHENYEDFAKWFASYKQSL